MFDIVLAVLLALATAAMAYMGVHLTLRPPMERNKRLWRGSFVIVGVLSVMLIAIQAYRTHEATEGLQTQLNAIQHNTEHPASITVTPPSVHVSPPQVIVKSSPPPLAKLQFSFPPLQPSEGLVNSVSIPVVDGAALVEFTAKNTGDAQADNGQIWIQICDGCKYAEEPSGSTAPPGDPVVRRKRFDHLYKGSYFETTRLKIIPPPNIRKFTIAFKYACETCPAIDNDHPQKLTVNLQ